MPKKNKALKQLIRAQMQAGAQGNVSGNTISGEKIVSPNSSPLVYPTQNKDTNEMPAIKKDVWLSLLLIVSIVIILFIVFAVDKTNPFLLDLSNKVFKLIQK